MTEEQIDALIDYIDAAIAAALDDGTSSDEGLISSIAKDGAARDLREAMREEE